MATEYTIRNAYLSLPHLVHCAKMRKTITYGELGQKIDRHWRAMRWLLAYIRDEICVPRGLPYITAIVVNQTTQLPGGGWLPEGTEDLTSEQYRRKFEEVRDLVFACDAWDALLRELQLSPVERAGEDLHGEGLAYAVSLDGKGEVREADSHRALKEYVAHNPAAIGLGPIEPGEQEYLFVSGDRCDVVFDLGENGYAVVEIKNDERGDLVRGIYQAVKYRALMEAEKGHGEHHQVRACLVAYDIPDDIAALAKRFDIRCYVAPRSVMKAQV